MGKTDGGKSTPCKVCNGFTKIPLPCGTWVCPMVILGAASHTVPTTLAKAA